MSANTNPMSEKQISFIRDLFAQVGHLLSEEKAKSLIGKMKGHISGDQIQTTVWANQVIQVLKGLKTQENLRVAQERRAANTNNNK
jgi:hypothetical protein